MNPYVLAIKDPQDLIEEFKKIGVDWRGGVIMAPKGFTKIVKIHGIPFFLANILKQDMLSIGGDVALSRGSITGQDKKTDCLVLGNSSQISQFIIKLKCQPFGLSKIGAEIKEAVARCDKKDSFLEVAGQKIRMGRRTFVMGIVNMTQDSFSGDGCLAAGPEKAFEAAQDMVQSGADILDVGGESSRPGARRISVKEELSRVVPLLKRLKGKFRAAISIDTTKSEVAHAALDYGASIINDISALRFDRRMAKLVARYKACIVLMHMKGTPRTMQSHPEYTNCMGEITAFLSDALKRALDAGISLEKIILDPGIGFGKNLKDNLEILNKLKQLRCFGRPLLVGLSRKYFIGKLLNADASRRTWGTAAALTYAIVQGADIVRVHDVVEMKQVVRVADAFVRQRGH